MSKQKDRNRANLEVYAEQSVRCAVCWWRKFRPGRQCELHHIVGRRGHDPHHHRNLLMVCNECHYGYHSGGAKTLSLGQILQAKEDEDGEVDIPFLAKLMGRKGLKEDPLPLPSWAIRREEEQCGQVMLITGGFLGSNFKKGLTAMPINSRTKGKVGELELCHTLKELFGWEARRSQQHCGDAGDADVVIEGMEGAFPEVKRVEKLNVTQAVEKAVEQCQGKTPLLFHRTNRSKVGWLLTLRLEDLMNLLSLVDSMPSPQEPSDPLSESVTTLFQRLGFGVALKQWHTGQSDSEKGTG